MKFRAQAKVMPCAGATTQLTLEAVYSSDVRATSDHGRFRIMRLETARSTQSKCRMIRRVAVGVITSSPTLSRLTDHSRVNPLERPNRIRCIDGNVGETEGSRQHERNHPYAHRGVTRWGSSWTSTEYPHLGEAR